MADGIALNLARVRVAKGLSQEALANRLGLSRQAISKWERGESVPDVSNLLALSDLYGVPVDELLRGPRKENSASEPDGDVGPAPEQMPEGDASALVSPKPEENADGPAGTATEAPSADDESASAPAEANVSAEAAAPCPLNIANGESPEPASFPAEGEPLSLPARLWQEKRFRTALIAGLCCLCALAIVAGIASRVIGDPDRIAAPSAPSAPSIAGAGASDTRCLREVTRAEIDAAAIANLDIAWYNGSVKVNVVDDDETDGMIVAIESASRFLKDEELMTCLIDGNTLEISTVNAGLLLDVPQHLVIQIPASAAAGLDQVDLAGMSCDYDVRGISCDRLTTRFPTNSESLRLNDVTARYLNYGNGGGDDVLEGSFDNVALTQGNGTTRLVNARQPETLIAHLQGGEATILLPSDSSFAAHAVCATGAAFACDFPEAGTAPFMLSPADDLAADDEMVDVPCYGRESAHPPLYMLTVDSGRLSIKADAVDEAAQEGPTG